FGSMDLDDLLELLDWVDNIAVVSPSKDLISPSVPTTRSIIRFTDRWMNPESNKISAYDASEGALYVLFALVLAMHPQSPCFFAIDNFDQAMHPRLARATMRVFSQQLLKTERQALITTHNPLALDGLDLRDDRIRLFTVERNPTGATEVHEVKVSDEVIDATQSGLSLSNLWVMGRLGGVPDIF
ncbi:MAG: ATP-binding protein, partial [Anaerolineae bacterium]|nr:ATP-binding protein [Anaerolineae bacterium]